MQLPDHIYEVVRQHFDHHAPWHFARLPENAHLRGPGTRHPTLKGINEPGSGEQFLRFHREMARVFKWITENTPGPAYPYTPWSQLPPWLDDLFEASNPGYLSAAYAETNRLVAEGTADQLGNFIEATQLDSHPAREIHNFSHGTISRYERQTFGATHERLINASMGSFATAPNNEHFWGLHGWIDEVFAEWQRQHGEEVDQSPLEPGDHIHAHAELEELAPELTFSPEQERAILRPIWDR